MDSYGALPTYLSPSKLQTFAECPKKFEFAAILRIPDKQSYASTKGRFIHAVLERLLAGAPDQRTRENANGFIGEALTATMDEQTKVDIGYDDQLEQRLLKETDGILDTYFTMETPASVKFEGLELPLRVEIDGTPLYGILDRLDRNPDGTLTIIDYKTGRTPSRNYDAQTFANADLYAAMCQAELGETPVLIRLLYIANGDILDRVVTPAVVKARADAATRAWVQIGKYHAAQSFPLKKTPSPSTCRFCNYQDRCPAFSR